MRFEPPRVPHHLPPSAAPWPAPPPDAHPTATAPTTQAPHVVLPTSPTQARVVSCRNHIQPIANLLQDTPLAAWRNRGASTVKPKPRHTRLRRAASPWWSSVLLVEEDP